MTKTIIIPWDYHVNLDKVVNIDITNTDNSVIGKELDYYDNMKISKKKRKKNKKK